MATWNPVHEAEKKAKSAVDHIVKPAANAAKSAVEKAGHAAEWGVKRAGVEAENSVKSVGHGVESGIRKLGVDIEHKLQSAGHDIKDGFTKDLPEKIKHFAHELAKEASEESIKKVLDNAADVVELMAPDSFCLIFGIELSLIVQGEVTVQFAFPNPAAKLTEIRSWAENPPQNREEIIECIKDFGPESLTVEGKISGNGISATWNGEDKYDKVSAFLEKHGVH